MQELRSEPAYGYRYRYSYSADAVFLSSERWRIKTQQGRPKIILRCLKHPSSPQWHSAQQTRAASWVRNTHPAPPGPTHGSPPLFTFPPHLSVSHHSSTPRPPTSICIKHSKPKCVTFWEMDTELKAKPLTLVFSAASILPESIWHPGNQKDHLWLAGRVP